MKTFFLKNFGCTQNLGDGQVISYLLCKEGYKEVNSAHDAQIVVYNTCGVKKPTENKIIKELKKVPKDKKLVITGCLPLINKERLEEEVNWYSALVGPAPGKKIIEVVKKVERGKRVELLQTGFPPCGLPKKRTNRVADIIPINRGCLGECAYCCTRLARGGLKSYKEEDIKRTAEAAIKSGCKELWLTSQDTAAYGKDISTTLAKLLGTVCMVEGKFFVRVGMMNPKTCLEILDELVLAYKNAKVFKFLHVPVQSGSDMVLSDMNRKYCVSDFKKIIKRFRREIPRITISTDIICGYPTETEKDWQKTLKLIEWLKPDVLNISRYWHRPGTKAEKLKALHGRFTKERSRELTALFEKLSLEKNKKWIGWTGEVLVDEKEQGRNFAYKQVVVKEKKSGEFTKVRIEKAGKHHLVGRMVTKGNQKA